MTITVPRTDFVKALERTSKVAPSKSPMTILKHALFEADGKRMRYAASDLRLSVSGTILAEGVGAFAADPKEIQNAVGALSGEFIKLTHKGNKLQISADGKRRFTVSTLDAKDFPPLASMPEEATALPDGFRAALERVAFAVLDAPGDDRPIYRGIHVLISGGSAALTATDGMIAAHYAIPAQGELEFILPAPAVKVLCGGTGDLAIARVGQDLLFRSGAEVLAVREIEGKFPPVAGVIKSTDLPNHLTVNAPQLSETLAAVGRINPSVELALSAVAIRVNAATQDSDSTDEVPAECSQEISIGISARNLIEALKGIDGDVTINYGSDTDNIRFTHEAYLAMVALMRLDYVNPARAA